MASAFASPAGAAQAIAPATDAPISLSADPGLRARLALARLQASRRALRLELLPPQPSQGSDEDPAGAGERAPLHRLWRRLRRWARSWAPGSVLVEAVEQTWRVHPLRPVAVAITEGYQTQVAPLLRRHPWAMVAVAAGLGAALVLGKRWHAPLLASTLRPLPQRLGRWLLAQLASAPVQTAVAGWLMMRATSARTAAPAADSFAAPAAGAESRASAHPAGAPQWP